MQPIETHPGYCAVCGVHTTFTSFTPMDFPCKRNDFVCQACGSIGRNRHVALTILSEFDNVPANSLKEFAANFEGSIYITCVKEAVYRSLKDGRAVTCSEYIDGVPSGQTKDGVLCQDLQKTTFADATFDLIITEDVLEHVPEPKRAFAEIGRILKPGGLHIGTLPINWHRDVTVPRAKIFDGVLVHLMEPEYHGDPSRSDGILAFTDYGRDVVSEYCSITGPSKMLSANGDRVREQAFGIYNNWVFVSQKMPTPSVHVIADDKLSACEDCDRVRQPCPDCTEEARSLLRGGAELPEPLPGPVA